jgi:hypothetical protein
MSEEKKLSPKIDRRRLHDDMTAAVKEIVAKEKSLQDAKTARLRKLRAARDKAAAAPRKKAPAKKKGKR